MAEIVATEGVMGGQPRLAGHRISVLQIAEWTLDEGMAPEAVSAEFDLPLADIYRALTYYTTTTTTTTTTTSRRRTSGESADESGFVRARKTSPAPERSRNRHEAPL